MLRYQEKQTVSEFLAQATPKLKDMVIDIAVDKCSLHVADTEEELRTTDTLFDHPYMKKCRDENTAATLNLKAPRLRRFEMQ
jgi:hypothetical protein